MDSPKQSAIKKFLHDPKWSFIEQIRDEMITEIRASKIPKDSQWELARTILERDGQVKGIIKFFQKLNEISKT